MYVNLHTMMAIGNGTTQDTPIQNIEHTCVRHTADGIGIRKDDIGDPDLVQESRLPM